jgi:hypothetical protein
MPFCTDVWDEEGTMLLRTRHAIHQWECPSIYLTIRWLFSWYTQPLTRRQIPAAIRTFSESARYNIPLDLLEQRIHTKPHIRLAPPRALLPASMLRWPSLAPPMQRIRLVSVQRLA